MKNVSFIMTEDGDDLIVSFAIPGPDLFDVKSLTLLRMPKYEFILDDAERGVNVSYDDFLEDEDDYLEKIEIGKDVVRLVASHRRYALDIRHVADDQKKEMKRILKRMNFDGRFTLEIV